MYLVAFNNTNLKSLSGLSSSDDLSLLYAFNCSIASDDGLGGDGDGLDELKYLNLERNVTLTSVANIKKCDSINELYLAGCTSMNYDEAVALEPVILRCGSNYSIPETYSLGFKSVTSQEITSGANFTDENLEVFRGKTNIKRLSLKNCSSLSDKKLNEILSTMTGLQYLDLSNCRNLITIDFVDSMNLIQLLIDKTKVTNLTKLNDNSSSKLSSLFFDATCNINECQTLMSNVYSNTNNSDTSKDSYWRYNSWKQNQGLIIYTVENVKPSIEVKVVGNMNHIVQGICNKNVTYDFTGCNSAYSISCGDVSGKIKLPTSLTSFFLNFGKTWEIDFSNCNLLKKIEMNEGDNNKQLEQSFSTLPRAGENNIHGNKIETLILKRFSSLTNLEWLCSFDTYYLKSLTVAGWHENESVLTKFTSTSGIENATNLTSLTLNYTYLNSLSGVDSLKSLTTLNASCNKIASAEEIGGCSSLTTLDISKNQISSISFMSNLINITTADFSSNSISSLTDFTNLTKLNTLNLSNCTNLADISKLETLIKSGKTTLKTLNLTNCSGIEKETITGYSNSNLIEKLKSAGCTSITTTGTRL